MDTKVKVTPCVCISHDRDQGHLTVEMEMPGVDKKDIKLDMRKDSFCVSAPRGEDTEYAGCFMLAHDVLTDKTAARYENGLLRINAPIRGWEQKVNVPIQ
ncbi:MAG: Hsp20/alpha crystallin family protein [Deltaproteobacteria bacterium]|nr:Hsp20/alpha crystallin family protein [Deltaproteobacteria bacterium]